VLKRASWSRASVDARGCIGVGVGVAAGIACRWPGPARRAGCRSGSLGRAEHGVRSRLARWRAQAVIRNFVYARFTSCNGVLLVCKALHMGGLGEGCFCCLALCNKATHVGMSLAWYSSGAYLCVMHAIHGKPW